MGAESKVIMENILYWIWLSILNLEPCQKNKLLEIYKNPKNIYNQTKSKLEKIIFSEKIIKELTSKEKLAKAETILLNTEKAKIEIITIDKYYYPYRLKYLPDFPMVLYARGNKNLLNIKNTIAIVGSRKPSEYGRHITLNLSYKLARKDYCIISGLAKGIDSYAHKGALIAKGKTIAILGSGIDNIYPKENEKLYHKILSENGLIISEYPLNEKPLPTYFPKRNRIISGLSDKILVTEANSKSGSIITANLGLEQGKDIYAIPGNITNYNSEGTNNLIKDGAFLVTNLEDIIDL